MALLKREEILGAGDLPTETVAVPEWGGEVIVKTMMAAERDAWEAANVKGRGKSARLEMVNIRARLVAATVVDEAGALLFKPGDVEALGAKSGAAMDRVFAAAMKLNGLSDRDLEELEKN